LADSGSWLANSHTLPKGLLRAILIQTTFSSHQLVQYFNLNNNNNNYYYYYFIFFIFLFFKIFCWTFLPNFAKFGHKELARSGQVFSFLGRFFCCFDSFLKIVTIDAKYFFGMTPIGGISQK